MAQEMVKENYIIIMELLNMMVILLMVNVRVMANIFMKAVIIILDNG